jgi:hypothetical protein
LSILWSLIASTQKLSGLQYDPHAPRFQGSAYPSYRDWVKLLAEIPGRKLNGQANVAQAAPQSDRK